MSLCWSNGRRFAVAALLACALGVALPATATAAPALGFDALVEQGLVAYKARDYRQAVEKFLQANAMQPDPNLLFNLARCYEALGDTRAATEKYRLFLASPDADPSGRQRAEDRLRALRRRPAGVADRPAPSGPSVRAAAPAAAATTAEPPPGSSRRSRDPRRSASSGPWRPLRR